MFESVSVAAKGDRFEYVLDLAGQKMAVAGSGVKAEKVELSPEEIKKHEKMAQGAIEEIQNANYNGSEYEPVLDKAKAIAKEQEAKYQPELSPGININVVFHGGEADKKDGDIDFEVVIAPNDTTKSGRVNIKARLSEAEVITEVNNAATQAELDFPTSAYPTAETWVATFAVAGKEIKVELGPKKNENLTLASLPDYSVETLADTLERALLLTLDEVNFSKYVHIDETSGVARSLTPAEIQQLQEDIELEITSAAPTIAESMANKPLIFVKGTGIPRNVKAKNQPFVNVNPNLESMGTSKSQALYHGVLEKAEGTLNSVLKKGLGDAQIHHLMPLYLGGTHHIENLLTLFGMARIESTAHGMMHKVIDETRIDAYLETDREITLENSSVSSYFSDDKLDILIGLLKTNGSIEYRKSGFDLVKKNA